MVESLERLLLEQFTEKTEVCFVDIPQASKDLLNGLVKSPSKENETLVLANLHIVSYIERYLKFRETVRTGVLGKTAILWMSYMDHVWLTLNLLQAVKTNDFFAYSHCLCLMPDLLFSFGGQNYARYMAFFSMFITNIETSHPGATELLRRGAFSVARSFIPGNRCEVDKTIEETFMKVQIQGWKWILWCRTDGVTNQLRCISTMDQICFRASEVSTGHVQPGRYGGRPVCRQRTSW